MKMGNRKKKKLPIGISDFKEIIENNYYYFDKTKFIENILEDGSKVKLFTLKIKTKIENYSKI